MTAMSNPSRQHIPAWTPGNVSAGSPADTGPNRVFNFNNMSEAQTAHLVKRVNRGRKIVKSAGSAHKA